MSVGHYENFPVASVLLPAALRHPVSVIYRFARTADDFADEGDVPPQERLARLEGYRAELRGLEAGRFPGSPLFRELREVVAAHRLPLAPFYDLLDAAAHQLLAGCANRFPQEPHLSSAGGHGEVRRDRRPDRRERRLRRLVGPDALPARAIAADDVTWRAARQAAAGTHRTGDPHRGSGRSEDPREARAGTRKRFPPPPGVAPLGLAADARARAGDAVTPDEYCQHKAAQSGSSFYYSFLFLPPERRRAITALYAFCREVDDAVDEPSDPSAARARPCDRAVRHHPGAAGRDHGRHGNGFESEPLPELRGPAALLPSRGGR